MKRFLSVLFLLAVSAPALAVDLKAILIAYYDFATNTNDTSSNSHDATNNGSTFAGGKRTLAGITA